MTLRNNLTHPKELPAITVDAVRWAVQAIITGIDVLFQAIYHRPFPVAAVAGVDDFQVAEATYRAAVARWPMARIMLPAGRITIVGQAADGII